MNVLVACERSGIVRDAFRAQGCNAYSCDLFPSRVPGPHFQCDVRLVLPLKWDLLIAHPVCRYLTNSGVRWLHSDPARWALMKEGAEFFKLFDNANHIPFRAVENPIMHGYALKLIGRRADQFVQPWWFGDSFRKATGLWLHGLPLLKATHKLSDYSEPPKQECWLMGPSEDREEKRSQTYPMIANAFVTQWIPYIYERLK